MFLQGGPTENATQRFQLNVSVETFCLRYETHQTGFKGCLGSFLVGCPRGGIMKEGPRGGKLPRRRPTYNEEVKFKAPEANVKDY